MSSENTNVVPFYKLIAFADSKDKILMIVGTIGAVGNGMSMPIMTLLFGQLIDSFGTNKHNPDVVDEVSKVALKFVYLAIGTGVVSCLRFITIDGIEIKQLQLKWLRQQMGLVSQEPALFNDTIRANIAYGKKGNASEAEIIAAAELANAHKLISGLAQGYDTVVGERGVQLSGGQKQRIVIARAMVKSPKMMLLDEATSALDAESERAVQDALDRVMVNRTTVIVAHRLSTIKGADLIAVVKNGVIVEKGRHETLVNITNGFYASLISLHVSAS